MTEARKRQLQLVLAAPSVAGRLRHEGWNSPYDTEPIDADDDYDQFARAMRFIETVVQVVPTRVASGKVTSLMLKQLHRDKSTAVEDGRNQGDPIEWPEWPEWYGYVSHGVFILAAMASGFADLGPSTDGSCSSSKLKISAHDWKML